MTLKEWCEYTSNVLNGETIITIYYRYGKSPIRGAAGCISDEIMNRRIRFATVKKINPVTKVIEEVKVKLV